MFYGISQLKINTYFLFSFVVCFFKTVNMKSKFQKEASGLIQMSSSTGCISSLMSD